MTPCFLMLTPLLRYTGLNRNCHVRLSWHLMRINSAYHVQQEEFTTASVQTSSVAVKSRSTAHTELSFLHRGDAPVRLAGDFLDLFRCRKVDFSFQLSPGRRSAGQPQEVVQSPVTVICRNHVPLPIYWKARQLFPKSFLLKCIFSSEEFLQCSKWKA